jgi:hypothetical protein
MKIRTVKRFITLASGVNPYQTITKLSYMPWFDKDEDLVPLFNSLSHDDPVATLFNIESLLILFFVAVSYFITKIDTVRPLTIILELCLPMKFFYPINSLIVSRNLWLILLSKI